MIKHLTDYPALYRLVRAQLEDFPAHQAYLEKRFGGAGQSDLRFASELAEKIARIVGDALATYCADYRWLTEAVLEEEIYFRRHNSYRLSKFADAEAAVYSNAAYMTRYMNGLLMSQLWWSNHTQVMRYFRNTYLRTAKPGGRLLEIGPGHGLFLYFAAQAESVGEISGWDISPSSIAMTRSSLSRLAVDKEIQLETVNLFDAPAAKFDMIVFSEVLEHLEHPDTALQAVKRLLAPGGRAFVNAPVNSPAPDHITLFRTPEEIVQSLQRNGLEVDDVFLAPTTGATIERARKLALAISTVVIARNGAAP